MPKTLDEVSRDAAALSESEQLKLARMLLTSFEHQPEAAVELSEEWDLEIQRRLDELASGSVKGVPLADFKRRMESKFRR